MSCPALYTVLLLGASGETGKQLLKQLAASKNVGKVIFNLNVCFVLYLLKVNLRSTLEIEDKKSKIDNNIKI